MQIGNISKFRKPYEYDIQYYSNQLLRQNVIIPILIFNGLKDY